MSSITRRRDFFEPFECSSNFQSYIHFFFMLIPLLSGIQSKYLGGVCKCVVVSLLTPKCSSLQISCSSIFNTSFTIFVM